MSYYLSSYYSPYHRSLHWDSPYSSWRYASASPYYSSYYPYYSRYSSPYWRSSYYAAPEVRTTTVSADDWPYSPARHTTTTTVERRSPVSPVYDTSYAYTTRDYGYDYAYPSYSRSHWYDRPYYGSRYYDYSPYSSYRTYYI